MCFTNTVTGGGHHYQGLVVSWSFPLGSLFQIVAWGWGAVVHMVLKAGTEFPLLLGSQEKGLFLKIKKRLISIFYSINTEKAFSLNHDKSQVIVAG